MRLILIILIAIIAFGVVQSYRHGCKFGEAGWYDCVMGRTAEAPTPATPKRPLRPHRHQRRRRQRRRNKLNTDPFVRSGVSGLAPAFPREADCALLVKLPLPFWDIRASRLPWSCRTPPRKGCPRPTVRCLAVRCLGSCRFARPWRPCRGRGRTR